MPTAPLKPAAARYDKITSKAARLVRVGEEISAEYGIPIVNKRISVTPVSLVAAACGAKDFVPFAPDLGKKPLRPAG